jgi:general secretion pathway protein J
MKCPSKMFNVAPTKRRSRLGMTLIEVMVALAMFSAIGALIYGGFSQTSRAKQVLGAQLDRYHELRVGMERMVRELSMAYMSTHYNPLSSLRTMRTTFIGKASGFGDRIDFTAVSHTRIYRDAKESDQEEISYFVTDDAKGDTKVLARRVQARPDDKPEEGGRIEVLISDVLEFELEYLDQASWEWVETWDAVQGSGQTNRLPAQVRIKVTVPGVDGKKKREVFGTRAILPMTWAFNHANYL